MDLSRGDVVFLTSLVELLLNAYHPHYMTFHAPFHHKRTSASYVQLYLHHAGSYEGYAHTLLL